LNDIKNGHVRDYRDMGRPTLMSETCEDALAEWVDWQAFSGKPRKVRKIRRKAYQLIREVDGKAFVDCYGKPKLPSYQWWNGFKHRHNLTVVGSKYRSTNAPTRAEYDRFFDRYERAWNLHKYPPYRIWNMDETGRARHDKAGRVVVGKALSRRDAADDQDSDNENDNDAKRKQRKRVSVAPLKGAKFNDHVTMVCCIAASGEALPVSYIVPGKTFATLQSMESTDDNNELYYTTGICPARRYPAAADMHAYDSKWMDDKRMFQCVVKRYIHTMYWCIKSRSCNVNCRQSQVTI
jgi:hypothetical protein